MQEEKSTKFLAYRTGFMDGKFDILSQLIKGEPTPLEEITVEDGDWYSYGYYDAISLYIKDYLENHSIDEATIHGRQYNELIHEGFTNRVTEYNQEHNTEVPIGKFRM